MTARLFSILQRREGLIDFSTPLRPESEEVAFYRLKTDTSPFGAFSTVALTAPRTGYLDKDVSSSAYSAIIPGENVRIIFKPSNHSLPDQDFFWLKLYFVDSGGSDLGSPAPSAATLVLPPYTGQSVSGFSATAPASQSQVDLPRQMDNFRFYNRSTTNALAVAFQDGGPEITIAAESDLSNFTGIASSIWVRGIGGAVDFSCSFSYANPR